MSATAVPFEHDPVRTRERYYLVTENGWADLCMCIQQSGPSARTLCKLLHLLERAHDIKQTLVLSEAIRVFLRAEARVLAEAWAEDD